MGSSWPKSESAEDHGDHTHLPRAGCGDCHSIDEAKSMFGNPGESSWPWSLSTITVVAGCMVFLLLIGALVMFLLNRRKKQSSNSTSNISTPSSSHSVTGKRTPKTSKSPKPGSKQVQSKEPELKVAIQK